MTGHTKSNQQAVTIPQLITIEQRRAEFLAAQQDYRRSRIVKRFHRARAALAGASRRKKA